MKQLLAIWQFGNWQKVAFLRKVHTTPLQQNYKVVIGGGIEAAMAVMVQCIALKYNPAMGMEVKSIGLGP